MKRVASDENRHYLFYRDLATAAIEIDPSAMVSRSSGRCARSRCRAPASSTSSNTRRLIARAGIYDFSVHHEQILVPVVLRHWDIEALEGLDAEAEAARDAARHAHRSDRHRRPPHGRPPRRVRSGRSFRLASTGTAAVAPAPTLRLPAA